MDTRRLQHFLGHASITNTVRLHRDVAGDFQGYLTGQTIAFCGFASSMMTAPAAASVNPPLSWKMSLFSECACARRPTAVSRPLAKGQIRPDAPWLFGEKQCPIPQV